MKYMTRTNMLFTMGAAMAMLLMTPASVLATGGANGYQYQLHNVRPPAGAFDKDPSTFRHKPATIWVEQGPHYTMTWATQDQHTLKRASFARGMMRMGLFVPHWDFRRPASDATGWTSYGRPLEYKSFNVDIQPAAGDRKIEGAIARHYVLKADFTNRNKGNSGWMRTTLTGNFWIAGDKPFSWATFATPGIYGDPRLDAAMSEKLSKLGLVVRAETTYHTQPMSSDGKKLGDGRDGNYLTWLSDIRPAKVRDVSPPSVSYQTTRELQHATWKDADGTCKTVMAGGTPDFVGEMLSGGQQAPFLDHLRAACKRRAERKHRT
ncbi:MAG: hypothetical protein PVI56_06370 [Gammaproteobacteria bacterium]|jgi:hypothetical protein